MPGKNWPIIGYVGGKPVYPLAGGDGTEGEGEGGDDGGNPPETQQKPEAKFTQADLDRIVQERLARAKPADYEDFKAKAAEFDKLQEGRKDEIQRAKDAQTKAEQKANEAIARANSTLKRAELLSMATQLNAADPEIVVALLVNSEDVTVGDDGNVVGAKDAVTKLLKDKPILKRGTGANTSGGEFGGDEGGNSIDKQIADAEAKGDWTRSLELKTRRGIPQA